MSTRAVFKVVVLVAVVWGIILPGHPYPNNLSRSQWLSWLIESDRLYPAPEGNANLLAGGHWWTMSCHQLLTGLFWGGPASIYNAHACEQRFKRKTAHLRETQAMVLGLVHYVAYGYRALEDRLLTLRARHPDWKILAVSDIDSTLIRTPGFEGSDSWFRWQLRELEHGSSVARTRQNLLELNSAIHELGGLVEVQRNGGEIVQRIGSRFPFLLLTSRGPEWARRTRGELEKNGIVLPTSISLPEVSISSDRLQQDFQTLGIPIPKRSIGFDHRTLYGSGQDKGAILRGWLRLANWTPDAIVFIDDSLPDCLFLQSAFLDLPIHVETIHFLSPKKRSDNVWNRMWSRRRWPQWKQRLGIEN